MKSTKIASTRLELNDEDLSILQKALILLEEISSYENAENVSITDDYDNNLKMEYAVNARLYLSSFLDD